MGETKNQSLFNHGNIISSASVAYAMNGMDYPAIAFKIFASKSLSKHLAGDWGDLSSEDKQANDAAIKTGDRLLSAYIPKQFPQLNAEDHKLYIITEPNRTTTTLFFAQDL